MKKQKDRVCLWIAHRSLGTPTWVKFKRELRNMGQDMKWGKLGGSFKYQGNKNCVAFIPSQLALNVRVRN